MIDREDDMGRHKSYAGLRCHHGKDGRCYFYTDTRIGGHGAKGRRVYSRHGAVDFEDAVRRHKELTETEWRWQHGLGSPEPDMDRAVMSFNDATKLWLKALEAAGRDVKTIRSYRNSLAHIARYVGEKTLDTISLEDLEAIRIALKERALSFRTRRNAESVASSFFAFALHPTRGWASQNPFQALVAEKAPKTDFRKGVDFRRLHPREDKKLLDACASSWHRCAVAIALYLGVRQTPVACLRVEDVNLFSKVIRVPSEFNKGIARGTRTDQWLPIPRHLLPFVRDQIALAISLNSPWLFPTGVAQGRRAASGHIYPSQLYWFAQRAGKAIGYPDACFHALRAICNNRIRAAGIADALADTARGARGVLGHASEQSAAPYLDASVEYLRPVIEAYDRWLDEKAAVQLVVELPR